jgi:hypothetical protein
LRRPAAIRPITIIGTPKPVEAEKVETIRSRPGVRAPPFAQSSHTMKKNRMMVSTINPMMILPVPTLKPAPASEFSRRFSSAPSGPGSANPAARVGRRSWIITSSRLIPRAISASRLLIAVAVPRAARALDRTTSSPRSTAANTTTRISRRR